MNYCVFAFSGITARYWAPQSRCFCCPELVWGVAAWCWCMSNRDWVFCFAACHEESREKVEKHLCPLSTKEIKVFIACLRLSVKVAVTLRFRLLKNPPLWFGKIDFLWILLILSQSWRDLALMGSLQRRLLQVFRLADCYWERSERFWNWYLQHSCGQGGSSQIWGL